jgi:arginyl-tRNA synthetase
MDAVTTICEKLSKEGILVEDQGCKVIKINEKYNGNSVPPFIMIKSNGAAKYEATDLGTIYNRVNEFHPDRLIYMTDKRQSMYF